MEFKVIVFWVLAAVLVAASLRVITAKNSVHAALYLVLAFFNAAGIWMLLQAEFLAIALVLVYVGAVMVLFLFVLMMLDINFDKMREGFRALLPLALIVGVLTVVQMTMVLWTKVLDSVPKGDAVSGQAGYSNTKSLGMVIYTQYVYAVEIAAVILLVAIVAAIALTLRRRKQTKYQNPSQQINVRRADRVRLLNIASSGRDETRP